MRGGYAVALLLVLAVSAHAGPGHAVSARGYLLPDVDKTPGLVALTDRTRVCATKWGLDRRHVTPAMKRQACGAYGATRCPGPHWELDHLIPRELGGADDERNLWPQPIVEARVKDRVENWLHRQVCAGRIGLDVAQYGIANDWTQFIEAASR